MCSSLIQAYEPLEERWQVYFTINIALAMLEGAQNLHLFYRAHPESLSQGHMQVLTF